MQSGFNPNAQKFIMQNGIPIKNPTYLDPRHAEAPPPSYSDLNYKPMAVVSTLDDQAAMYEITQLPAPPAFQATYETMQSSSYLHSFGVQGVTQDMLLEGLSKAFSAYEIPIGLMSCLMPLQDAYLHIKVDSSGSMGSGYSTLTPAQVSPYMRQFVNPNQMRLTRWQEAEDRLYLMMELLAFIPTGIIRISCFDHFNQSGAVLELDRRNKLPRDFLAECYQKIHQFFMTNIPNSGTPILHNLKNMVQEANQRKGYSDLKTFLYLLSDGEPNGGAEEIRQIKDFLKNLNIPMAFLGCSDQDTDTRWMREVEEESRCVSALADYQDEFKQVMLDQGYRFPYSRGYWLLCNVAAAFNLDTLDAMDQGAPFTKSTMDILNGYTMTDEAYQDYFNHHPGVMRGVWLADYPLFISTALARDIPSVAYYQTTLKGLLNRAMDNDNDASEVQEQMEAERAVILWRQGFLSNRLTDFSGSMFGSGLGMMHSIQYAQPQPATQQASCCTIS